jgi:hypothetical protein
MPDLIPVVEMIGAGVIEVDGDFHQSQPKLTGVEVYIALHIAHDRSHMVDTK